MGVKNCDQSGRKCEEAAASTIAVNGKVNGDVLGNGGLLKAKVQFYYAADKDHMPVRRVSVDFGDGSTKYDTSNIPSAPYPNRRGFDTNKKSLCNNSNFGQSKDACVDRPFTIEHVYQCQEQGGLLSCGPNGTPLNNETSCWIAPPTPPNPNEPYPTGACVFKPRVYIEDNWGYCTGPTTPGGCGNSSDPEGGTTCFDSQECKPETFAAPWINFGGKVVVLPP